MKKIFESVNLGGVSLKNRILRSATMTNCGDEAGHVSPKLLAIYEELAAGGVGAVITGMVGVDENSRVSPYMVKAYDDAFVPGLRQLVTAVQAHDCKLIVQISHCGAQASYTDSGRPPLAPSALVVKDKEAESLTVEEIQSIVQSFARAAGKCKEAGADAVQLHGAHGYLLTQFFSPFTNSRQDSYGGDLAGRARFVFEVYDAVRAEVGQDFPVFIKLSFERKPGGFSVEEGVWVSRELERRGINGIEVSVGFVKEEAMNAEQGLAVAEAVSTAVIGMGRFRSPAVIEEWLNKGQLQAVSLCRPFIREPALVQRWAEGDLSPARCISCSKCFGSTPGSFGCNDN